MLRGTDHEVIPDRIEAGTFLTAGAITGGEVSVEGCVPGHLEAVIMKLRESGVQVTEGKEVVRLKAPSRTKAVDVKTLAYPGFPTIEIQDESVHPRDLEIDEVVIRPRKSDIAVADPAILWIPQGRDPILEQKILSRLAQRFGPTLR